MQLQTRRPAPGRARDERLGDQAEEATTGSTRVPATTAPLGTRGRAPLSGDGVGRLRPLTGRLELAEQLEGMAASLGEVDPRAAERLEDLARCIGTEEGQMRWAEVDLRRAFNTERMALAYAVRREGGYAPASIDRADKARNVLVMLPVLLTWFALAEASRAYHDYVDKHPTEAGQSFLLLWQRGFGGASSILAPTFSTVATVDAIIILIIISLTIYAHGQREAREQRIQLTADSFQTDLDNLLAEATVILAADRASRPALLANSVERLAERFEGSSQELLNRLQVEHERLESIAGRREREFADFGVFASGMRAGAEETHRLLVDLRQVSNNLQTALEDLTSEIGDAGQQQKGLHNAVNHLERIVASAVQSDQAVTRQLTSAATSLAEASDRALAGAEAAAQAGRVATEAVRGIAELTTMLARSQERVETAIAHEADANGRLADAMMKSGGGLVASSKSLNEIGAGLAHLRDELARLGEHSAEQASALADMLAEQSQLAGGITQVARDLSAVGIATAQRQREVNEDLAVLVSHLDRLTQALGQAVERAPTADAIQQAVSRAVRAELSNQSDAGADAQARRGTGNLWGRGDRRP